MLSKEQREIWPELCDPDFPELYEVVALYETPNNTTHLFEPLPFRYNDGGRKDAGFKGKARDCVARSIAIASGLSYSEVYKALAIGNAKQRASSRTPKRTRSANNGVNTQRKWFKQFMINMGFEWVPTQGIGSTTRTYLSKGELPKGNIIVAVRKHYAAVINGVLNDTADFSKGRRVCVVGYWIKKT
ncbi:hypothetical protein AB6E89_08310 [Vibrio breoganii]